MLLNSTSPVISFPKLRAASPNSTPPRMNQGFHKASVQHLRQPLDSRHTRDEQHLDQDPPDEQQPADTPAEHLEKSPHGRPSTPRRRRPSATEAPIRQRQPTPHRPPATNQPGPLVREPLSRGDVQPDFPPERPEKCALAKIVAQPAARYPYHRELFNRNPSPSPDL